MSGLLWALPGAPAAAGAALACAGRRADRLAPGVAVVVSVLAAGLAVWAALARPAVQVPWLGPFPAGLAVDGLSAAMVVTVALVALAVVVFAVPEMREQPRARFFGLLLIFAAAMLATVTATNLVTLLLAWEVMGAMSWALIGFQWWDPKRPPAATAAFLTTRAADLGLYVAVAAAFAGAGTVQIGGLDRALAGGWLHVTVAGLLLAAAGKSAQLPFSSWLSAAMQGPTPVSALLHSATMVAAGAYLLLRVEPLLATTSWAGPVAAWLGAATAITLGLVAVGQRDLKQLLAASTCAHMGLLFVAAGAGDVGAGTAHLMAHAAFKALLFLGAGVYLQTLRTQDLTELRGASRGALRWPSALVAVGALTLAGLPPLSGWVTKDEVLAAALREGPALYAAGLAASFLSAAYAGRILATMYASDPVRVTIRTGSLASAQLASMAALAAVCVGWVTIDPPPAAAVELAVSAAVAVAGLALAWRLGPAIDETPAWSATWLGLARHGPRLVVAPALAAARALAAADDRAVDAGVRGAARVGALLSGLSSLVDRRVVDAAVRGLAARARGTAALSKTADERLVDRFVEGLAALTGQGGRAARRPQTGMLSRYYASTIAVLGGLALLVWALQGLS